MEDIQSHGCRHNYASILRRSKNTKSPETGREISDANKFKMNIKNIIRVANFLRHKIIYKFHYISNSFHVTRGGKKCSLPKLKMMKIIIISSSSSSSSNSICFCCCNYNSGGDSEGSN
jgi:hypothetical protein